jgi:hypothetical protein
LPVDYTYDKETGILHAQPSGIITIEDIQDYARQVEFDVNIPDSFIDIVDFSGTEKIAITYREAWQLRSIFNSLIQVKKYKGAILVGASELNYGMARMFATIVEGVFEVRVVRSLEEAEREVLNMRK